MFSSYKHMANLPAHCEFCGNLFQTPNLISASPGVKVKIKMTGNKVTCPNCGKFASIIDGDYELIGNTIKTIKSSGATIEQLKRLREILERARREHTEVSEVSEIVSREIPEVAPWFSILIPKTPGDFYSALAALLTAIGICIAWLAYQNDKKNVEKPPQETAPPTTINTTINNTTNNTITNTTNNVTVRNNVTLKKEDKPVQGWVRPKRFRSKKQRCPAPKNKK